MLVGIITVINTKASVISDYSAEKHAVLGLMEALEDEMSMLGKKNIKFTSVCPLLTKTNLTKPLSVFGKTGFKDIRQSKFI